MAGLLSLSQAPLFASLDKRGSGVALFSLDESGQGGGRSERAIYEQALKFQYFPETLTDSKEVNYQTKEIPGGSLPIYQWVSSGARTISFQAYFTCDNDLEQPNTGQPLADRLDEVGEGRRNVDIRSAVLWLRHFMLPNYRWVTGGVGATTNPPRKALLVIPKSGIGAAGGLTPNFKQIDSVICVMTQCEVTYEAFFTSGFPRIVVVQLSFAQVPQFRGTVKFPGMIYSEVTKDWRLTNGVTVNSSFGTSAGGATWSSNFSFFGYNVGR